MTSLLARAVRRARGPVREDSGFSLIEAVVALLVATVAFTALAAGAMSAIRGTMTGRMSQQAADFMGREIEKYRAYDFQAIANRATDMTGDSAVGNCSGNPCFDPGTGPERLYLRDGGGVTPHVTTVDGTEANQATFTLRTYVTAPLWAQVDYYRRLTVVVTWKDGSITRTRRDSTIITNTQRGLPLPVFKMTPYGSSTTTVNPGATVVFGFTVTNQGAPDRFDLTDTDPYTWDWFVDDGDGLYNPANDTTTVTDSDGNGTIDTGRLDPNASVKIWIVRTVPSTATDGAQNTTVTATSRAQPSADGGVQTLPFSAQVVTGVITPSSTPTGSSAPPTAPPTDCTTPASTGTGSATAGYSLRSYTLHNKATPGNTDAQLGLVMAQTAPYATTLYEYSQDVMAGQPGRVLLPATSTDAFPSGSLDPRKVADWSFPVGAKAYSGQAAVNLWVAPTNGSSLAEARLAAYVYKYTKSGSTYVASPVSTINLVVSPFLCGGFQQVGGSGSISIPASGSGSLSKNDWIGLRVVNLGTANTRIAYDVQSLYPAAVVLPEN